MRIESKASLYSKGYTAYKQAYLMVPVIFCTETSCHVNYNVSNQHGTSNSNPYNESNAQNKFIFKCWSCHASDVVHQLASFCELLCFWYLSCKYFPEITHQYIMFAPLFLHLKHFEASVLLCVVKGISLDIGLNVNLWHSLVLQSQISNFHLLTKKICLLCETIFIE